jgi:hypothetical protein
MPGVIGMSGGWTRGPWEVVHFGSKHHFVLDVRAGKHSEQPICAMYESKSEEYQANAALIAEAGTAANETGLTPRQLADQRVDLLAACIWAEGALAPFSSDPAPKSGINMLRAAIANARGEV